MSFSPRNVSTLLVGKTKKSNVSDLANVGDFVVKGEPVKGATQGQPKYSGFRIVVKTNGGVKASEFIPSGVKLVGSTIAAGAKGKLKLTYTAPSDFKSKTLEATIIVNDGIGSMLNERFISAFATTDEAGKILKSDGTTATATLALMIEEAVKQLAVLAKGEFTVTKSATAITVEEVNPKFQVGVFDGAPVSFSLKGDVDGNDGKVPAKASILTQGKISDLVQLKNIEWFNSGYDKDPYREAAFPHSFQADSNIVAAGIAVGDKIIIMQYHKNRDAVNVEFQHRQVIAVGTALVTEIKAVVGAVIPKP